MKYYNYLQGKRVIFVGGCPNIRGQELGNFIEDYDIVVKTNGSVFLNEPTYYQDYGKRIDVLYCNVQFAREMRPLPVQDFKERGIKWLCFKGIGDKDKEKYQRHVNVRHIGNIIKDVHQVCHGALMGCFIFTDILRARPKEFFITGIDFFISKKAKFEHNNYKEYLPGYLPDKIREQGNKINVGKTEDGHNVLANTRYIYDLFQKNENFKMSQETFILMKDIIDGKRKQD
jgi:hypothetical protein